MKTYIIENWKIEANNKKQAISKYINQYFETFMCKCDKSFSTLYRIAKRTN